MYIIHIAIIDTLSCAYFWFKSVLCIFMLPFESALLPDSHENSAARFCSSSDNNNQKKN